MTGLNDSQFNELKHFLREATEDAIKDRFRVIEKKLESIHNEVQTGFRHLDEDRKDFGDMKTSLATITQRSKEIYDTVATQTDRLAEKMDEKTEATMDKAVDKVQKKVEPVMNGVLERAKKGLPLRKKSWWRFGR